MLEAASDDAGMDEEVELDSIEEELLDERDEDDALRVCSAANCMVSLGFLTGFLVAFGLARKEVREVGSWAARASVGVAVADASSLIMLTPPPGPPRINEPSCLF